METIAQVIQKLEEEVNRFETSGDPRGYFAALYLKMTQRVSEGIQNGQFENPTQMEKLDVLFASRYFSALENWKNKTYTQSWKTAFEEAEHNEIAVLQHLLCGINAHINLDLGIAAAQTAPGSAIGALEADFKRINGVIQTLLGEVQQKLGVISWPMRFLDQIAGDSDSQVANFSIMVAREAAWKVAKDLAAIDDENARNRYIQNLDLQIAKLGSRIAHPGFFPNLILKPVKWFEKGSVGEIVAAIRK